MKIRFAFLFLVVLSMSEMSCSKYSIYRYKYNDLLGYGSASSDELMRNLIFYCNTDIIFDRITDTDFKSNELEVSKRNIREVDQYLEYKDRIFIPKGTKGVYFDDEEIILPDFTDEKYDHVQLRIWVDFGDSIIIPFSESYFEYKYLGGEGFSDFNENSKGLTRVDRYNLRSWKDEYLKVENKIIIPYDCTQDTCAEYTLKQGGLYCYLLCKNWEKYRLKTKTINKEIINEKKVKGKTQHNY